MFFAKSQYFVYILQLKKIDPMYNSTTVFTNLNAVV